MQTVFAILAASQLAPPEEAVARQLRAAIWYDLFSNAWIGNGNELAARWYNAGSERPDPPKLYIQELVCSNGTKRLTCRFDLFREGGPAEYLGNIAPERLACRATFRRADDGNWSIRRLPPDHDGGHSRITIKCKPRP